MTSVSSKEMQVITNKVEKKVKLILQPDISKVMSLIQFYLLTLFIFLLKSLDYFQFYI